MRILSNPEIKKYNISIIALFLITIILSIFINILNLNIIKADVIQNNQAIVGNIVSKYPELEKDIVSVITQAKNKYTIYNFCFFMFNNNFILFLYKNL